MGFAGGIPLRTGDAEEGTMGSVRAAVGSVLQTADMSAKLVAGSRLWAESGEYTLALLDEVLSSQPGECTLALVSEVASAVPVAVQLLSVLLMLLTGLPLRSSSSHELLPLLLLLLLLAVTALASLALFSSLCMPGMSQRTQSDSAIHASADIARC